MRLLGRIAREVWAQKAVLLTVLVGLLATNYALRLYLWNARAQALSGYSRGMDRQEQTISDRLGLYETLLTSGRSLWLSSDKVNQAVWKRFFRYESLDQGAVDAFGVILKGPPEHGRPTERFKVLEPYTRTLALQPQNLYRDRVLRSALQQAENTSGPVVLGRSDSLLRPSHGYLTVVEAIYKPAHLEPEFVGWVLLSVNLERCLGNIGSHQLALLTQDTPLAGSTETPPRWLPEQVVLPVFGRQITLRTVHPDPGYPLSAWFLVAAGLSFTLALSGFVWSLTTTGARAKRLAEKMTESLRIQERENAMLAMIARQTQNAVIVLDGDRVIEWTNAAFKAIVGTKADQAIGTHFRLFLASLGGEPEIIAEISESLKEAVPFGCDIRISGADGEPAVLTLKGTPVIDPQTGQVRTVIIGDDATSRVFYEEGLKNAHHIAEEASRAKSAFLANMSHEIRTPLNGIIGVIHLLESATSPEDRHDLIGIISRSAESLLGILNDVLDFSRIEAGQLSLEAEPFDLEAALEEVAETFERIATLKGVSFVFAPEPGMNRFYVGDRLRLGQVVRNLLSNAIKFTKEGHVALSANVSGDSITIVVSDTGIGIPEDRLESVFESFTQVDAGVTRRYGGTGLGLAICQQLVERLGGHIQVSSTLGQGSKFSIVIPATWGEAHDEDWRTATPGKGEAVELVGKDSLQTEAAQTWLEAWGYRVTLAPGQTNGLAVRRAGEAGWIEFETLFRPRQLFGALSRSPAGNNGSADLYVANCGSGSIRVLLVDDNMVNRKVGVRLLEQHGCEVVMAEDGAEAVREATAARFDLILMDIQMPVMDGITAAKTIRAAELSEKRPRTPILALTANALVHQVEEYLAAGMDGHVAKPIEISKLYDALSRVLSEQPESAAYEAA